MQSHRLHTQEEELHGLDPFIRPLLHKNQKKKYGTNIFALVFLFKLKWKKKTKYKWWKMPNNEILLGILATDRFVPCKSLFVENSTSWTVIFP